MTSATDSPTTSAPDSATSDADRGQVNASAAQVYDQFFVPALFGQWPPRLLSAAGVRPGDRIVDVGCGTGVLTEAAAAAVGSTGSVIGVDPNDGMLAVARERRDDVEWRSGVAEDLPVDSGSVDHVMSQFAAMFFIDAAAAMNEFRRCVRPGGRVTLATWADAAASPGYAAMIDLLRRLFGDPAADALLAPFRLGTTNIVAELFGNGFGDVDVEVVGGVARFPSIEAWMHTDIRGWTLAALIDDEGYAQLLEAAAVELAPFVGPDGDVEFAAPAIIATAAAN